MELLKKRSVALVLCVLAVLFSTLASTKAGLSRECAAVTDGFSQGTRVAGYTQPSLKKTLNNLSGFAANIYSIIRDSGDFSALKDAYEKMNMVLDAEKIDVSDAYDAYTKLMDELGGALPVLENVNADAYDTFSGNIAGIKKTVEDSGYNDTVRSYYRSNMGFPANILSDLAGIRPPELFE